MRAEQREFHFHPQKNGFFTWVAFILEAINNISYKIKKKRSIKQLPHKHETQFLYKIIGNLTRFGFVNYKKW